MGENLSACSPVLELYSKGYIPIAVPLKLQCASESPGDFGKNADFLWSRSGVGPEILHFCKLRSDAVVADSRIILSSKALEFCLPNLFDHRNYFFPRESASNYLFYLRIVLHYSVVYLDDENTLNEETH